ncbi:MAG: hypothetical protein JNL42_07130 [Anaerolineae bacterium]|nr:hypothetical protein [Anaerolineae bacterium]
MEPREPLMPADEFRQDAEAAEVNPASALPMPEAPVAEQTEPGRRSGFFERLGRLIAPDRSRLRNLDQAIARDPFEAGNYLARGEVLLLRGRRGDDEAAAVDFYKAVRLAEAQLEVADWGIGAQFVRDRALAELNALIARGIVLEFAEDETLRSDVETVQSGHSLE